MSVLTMIRNHQVGKLHPWSFGKCEVSFNCSQVHSNLDRFEPVRVPYSDQIELTDHLLTQFPSSMWPVVKNLSDAAIPSQSGPGSSSNEGVLHIPQSSKTETSLSDYLMSYPGHSCAGMQSVYSTVPSDWVLRFRVNRFVYVCVCIYIYIYIYIARSDTVWTSDYEKPNFFLHTVIIAQVVSKAANRSIFFFFLKKE